MDMINGDGAGRVSLSEAIGAVLNELDKATADLQAIRHRLQQGELPEEIRDRGSE